MDFNLTIQHAMSTYYSSNGIFRGAIVCVCVSACVRACMRACVGACHLYIKSSQVVRLYRLLPLFIQFFSRHIPEPPRLRPTILRCHQQVLIPRIKGIAVRSHHQRLGISPGDAHLQSVEFHIGQWLLREIARM